MQKILKWMKEEVINVIPPVVFFIITFNLIVFTEKLMLRDNTPGYFSYTLATVFALLMGKLLIIVNSMSFINTFTNKPLIYNITWKFIIYSIAIILFRLADKFIHSMIDRDNASAIYFNFKQMLATSIFWAVYLWLLMVFMVYIVSSEFIHVIGKNEVKRILFGARKKI